MEFVNTHKAILHEVDKCAQCRACQVACQREQGLDVPKDAGGNYIFDGSLRIAWDDPMIVKAQSANDSPPFVRYSCWHCDGPPCASHCPLGAMKIDPNTGAVYVDKSLCKPDRFPCSRQCVKMCRKGGFVRVRPSNVVAAQPGIAVKCDMCWDRLGLQGGKPACVATCPNNALTYGDYSEIKALASSFEYARGDGHIFWASNKTNIIPPAAEPDAEFHSSSIFSKSMSASASKMLTVPTLMVGGLYTLYQRRIDLKEDE